MQKPKEIRLEILLLQNRSLVRRWRKVASLTLMPWNPLLNPASPENTAPSCLGYSSEALSL